VKQARQPIDGVLLLNKPVDITSNAALQKAKWLLNARKAGHTGTLDPFATGLLPLVFGEATKFSRFLIDADKRYLATLQLGITTSTGDTEGEVISRSPVSVTFDEIERICASFVGESRQVPPMHSAVRVEGRRLYDLARQGLEIDRVARTIYIYSLEIEHLSGERLVISVKCSKGTYIRALAMDIGRELGCGAHLVALRRTGSGAFDLANATDLDTLARIGPEAARSRLLPVDILLGGLVRVDLDERQARALRNGQVLDAHADWPAGESAVYGPEGHLIGVARVGGGRLTATRLLFTGPAR